MISVDNLVVIKQLFKHEGNLLVIYLYKSYVFGIMQEVDPGLILPQISQSELERIFKTYSREDALLKIEALLESRCIFRPDMSIEIPVLTEIANDAKSLSVLTEVELRDMIKEFTEEAAKGLAQRPAPPPTDTPAVEDKPDVKSAKGSKQTSMLDKIDNLLKDDD